MLNEAMAVLFRPWRIERPTLTAEDRLLLVNITPHPDLGRLAPARRVAVQPWRQAADALASDVDEVVTEVPAEGRFSHGFVLPERQREAGLAAIARTILAVRDGGTVVVASAVREGGGRYADAVAALGVPVEVDIKARCRIVRLTVGPDLDRKTLRAWAALDAPCDVLGGTYRSRPGLFSWDRADLGSVILADVLPKDLGGRVADAGAGWGWLAREILDRCPAVQHLDLLEADSRALTLARQNLAGRPVHGHWVDATAAWPVSGLDAVVSNPPFHEGGRADPAIGQAFAARAWQALRPGGRLVIVANRHLPYEGILKELYVDLVSLADREGFKVIQVSKPVVPLPMPGKPPEAAKPERVKRGRNDR